MRLIVMCSTCNQFNTLPCFICFLSMAQFYIRWKSMLLWIDNAHELLNESPTLSSDKMFQIHDKTKVCIRQNTSEVSAVFGVFSSIETIGSDMFLIDSIINMSRVISTIRANVNKYKPAPEVIMLSQLYCHHHHLFAQKTVSRQQIEHIKFMCSICCLKLSTKRATIRKSRGSSRLTTK